MLVPLVSGFMPGLLFSRLLVCYVKLILHYLVLNVRNKIQSITFVVGLFQKHFFFFESEGEGYPENSAPP